MQFITTGNRIAVENFVLGDLYTITFTNGTYINSACIGIGDNFVTFQRNEPELLFSLTMATAELVSSIELYAGGTGTNDYDDLSNKPQINDVELVGNKSLSDLGIQATISDIDTIRSGAAAGATAVQPAALADYQPIISDLDTIRSGAAAGATAVQPAALAGYQTIIDSSHKLDADLVDDTTATHKFATAAQLSQIETNKNNISKFQSEIVSIDLTQLNFTQSGQGMYYSDPIALTNIKTILGWTVYDINNLKPTNMFMVAQKSNIAGYFRLLSSNTDFFSGGAGLNAEIQIRIFGTTDNP